MDYFQKYKKYKNKYMLLRKQLAGDPNLTKKTSSVSGMSGMSGMFAKAKQHLATGIDKVDEWNRARKDNCDDDKYNYLRLELNTNYILEDFVTVNRENLEFNNGLWNNKKLEAINKHTSDHATKKQIDKEHALSKQCIETIIEKYFSITKDEFVAKLKSRDTTNSMVKNLMEKQKDFIQKYNLEIEEKAKKEKKEKADAIELRNKTKISIDKVEQLAKLLHDPKKRTIYLLELDNVVSMRNYSMFVNDINQFIMYGKMTGEFSTITNVLHITEPQIRELSRKINSHIKLNLTDTDKQNLILLFFDNDPVNKPRIKALKNLALSIRPEFNDDSDMLGIICFTNTTRITEVLAKLEIDLYEHFQHKFRDTHDYIFELNPMAEDETERTSSKFVANALSQLNTVYVGKALPHDLFKEFNEILIQPNKAPFLTSYIVPQFNTMLNFYDVSGEDYGLVL
jgi:hypothetical protein